MLQIHHYTILSLLEHLINNSLLILGHNYSAQNANVSQGTDGEILAQRCEEFPYTPIQ